MGEQIDEHEQGEFFENEKPLDTKYKETNPTHEQLVQKYLGIVIIVAALAGFLIIILAYIISIFFSAEFSDRLKDLATYSASGLLTLAATVVGFYFGSQKN